MFSYWKSEFDKLCSLSNVINRINEIVSRFCARGNCLFLSQSVDDAVQAHPPYHVTIQRQGRIQTDTIFHLQRNKQVKRIGNEGRPMLGMRS